MKYVGSKNRLAKDLVPIIQSYIDKYHITDYYEHFIGEQILLIKSNVKIDMVAIFTLI